MVKWIITKYQHSWVDTRLLILVWTDERIHAFLHYSLSPEIYSYITSVRRGIRRLIKPLWELPDQSIQEQAQNGDTFAHAFYIPGIPNLATLTFFIAATQNGIEAKSVSIPIKVVHPTQGGADEVDCPDLEDTIRFVPWQSNHKDAVGCDLDIWNTTEQTGTAFISHNWDNLHLEIGVTPGSLAKIFTDNIFDLALDHTLDSQLRAVVRFPSLSYNQIVWICHGTPSLNPRYGFYMVGNHLMGDWGYSGATSATDLDIYLSINTTYLLEAKYKAGSHIEWWFNGTYIKSVNYYLPDGPGLGFLARIEDSDTPNAAIYFRRFMIWKESIWTGEYHGP